MLDLNGFECYEIDLQVLKKEKFVSFVQIVERFVGLLSLKELRFFDFWDVDFVVIGFW